MLPTFLLLPIFRTMAAQLALFSKLSYFETDLSYLYRRLAKVSGQNTSCTEV